MPRFGKGNTYRLFNARGNNDNFFFEPVLRPTRALLRYRQRGRRGRDRFGEPRFRGGDATQQLFSICRSELLFFCGRGGGRKRQSSFS